MKKILGVFILVVMLLSLVACGNSGIVASKETDNGELKVKEKIEVIFENDQVSKVEYTYKFEDSDQAMFYHSLNANNDNYFLDNVEQKGSKMTGTLKDISKYQNKTKEQIKEMLKEEGYEVK